MRDTLRHAIEAHGGLENWQKHDALSVDLVVGGMLWGLKGQAGKLERTNVIVGLCEEWASHQPFGPDNRRTRFRPDRVAIENAQGKVLEELAAPRASFAGHALETPWTEPQLAYFAGYAMWTYLNLPFLALYEGVEVEELPIWHENGEAWRPLRLTFSDKFATHSKVQTIYVGDDGLLRRHDYAVEIAGDSPAAHYLGNYVTVEGIKFPTERRVYVVGPNGKPMRDLLTVSVDLSNFRFVRNCNDTVTYRAVQAVAPGRLELTTKTLHEPPPGHVRIRVEACGVCHSDAATVSGTFPISWPRVPGHEVIGRIDALGEGVQGWRMGQRVGIGFLAGSCGHCSACRAGDLVHCENQEHTGVEHDGGYAEIMIAKAGGLVNVPDELASVAAAPLLCAGLTTFGALRNASAKAGDLVAIVGIGGLGHLAIQYARYMGFEVAAIGRGGDKAELAKRLGAHHYIDSAAANPGKALKDLGGATLIVNTASASSAAASALAGMKSGGTLIALGVGDDSIEISPMDLIFRNVTASGSLTGLPSTADATLKFSVLTPVAPMIETMPLERAAEAYDRMMKGDARFRIVLTMGQ